MKIKTPDISGTIGLPPEDIELIVKEISAFKEIEKALVFGSRAKGNYRQGSDVDIFLKGDNLSIHHKASLSWKLNEETILSWNFDILIYKDLNNQDLKDHINRLGIQIYP